MIWEKPVLRDLGAALIAYTYGECDSGGTPSGGLESCTTGTDATISCNLGQHADQECVSGNVAGALAHCKYGSGVTA
jgi:hypothetical protein